MTFDYKAFLTQLTSFPHRGVGSKYEQQAAQCIAQTLKQNGFEVEEHIFTTPATYVPIVYWLIGSLLAGLLTVQWWGPWSVGLVAMASINGLLYFDWRPSWLLRVPPLVKSQNIIGKHTTAATSAPKLLLMAHYDSAPVSFLYRRQTKDGFRNSIRVSMLLMALAVPVVGLSYHLPQNQYLLVIRILLAIYFLLQATLGTIDFFRKGYTNGASDNATGVVAAVATAIKLKEKLKNCNLEVVLTSAEEAGMIGAYHYWQECCQQKPPHYVINFDTLGAGSLKIITQSGSLTAITYQNVVAQTALQVAKTDARFRNVLPDSWHTADFDTAWFARAGVPCLTLAALDTDGTMPNIHRPEDTLDHVDTQPMLQAIELAETVGVQLDKL
jgi:Peptidase family M28